MLKIVGKQINSRMFLGTAGYPSLQVLEESVKASGSEVVTVSLRRAGLDKKKSHGFWEALKRLQLNILPNTAGCRTAKEAITVAKMAREIFKTNWIKLEVIGDQETLQPHPFELIEAARILCKEGFIVFPYTTEDLVLCDELLKVGCQILMPWASPIGSGRGLMNTYLLKTLRQRYPEIPMILDAGIGRPSHAVQAMEMGFDAVLLNTAVSQASNPIGMAEAFAYAIASGRKGFESGLMIPRNMAQPSTPVVGTPFWHYKTKESLL